jgi:hypothetical protein
VQSRNWEKKIILSANLEEALLGVDGQGLHQELIVFLEGGRTGVRTQGLGFAREVLFYLSHTTSLRANFY